MIEHIAHEPWQRLALRKTHPPEHLARRRGAADEVLGDREGERRGQVGGLPELAPLDEEAAQPRADGKPESTKSRQERCQESRLRPAVAVIEASAPQADVARREGRARRHGDAELVDAAREAGGRVGEGWLVAADGAVEDEAELTPAQRQG